MDVGLDEFYVKFMSMVKVVVIVGCFNKWIFYVYLCDSGLIIWYM